VLPSRRQHHPEEGIVSATSIDQLVARARRVGVFSRRPRGRLVRIVVRVDAEMVTRIDALRPRFDDVSRATIVRGAIEFMLAMAEEPASVVAVPVEEIDASG
jgi:hypothetical protein